MTRALSLTELGQQVLPKARLVADTVLNSTVKRKSSHHLQ
ncbi:hypothetical protein VCHA34P116_20082 [Vibrio chagasii]|nr:hypothetical protein VCHA34P116_20082 [Vibrio chagasii]CAH6886937.1 hypothetical protein VCHA32P90_20082 [Vibrio chagasii]CAH7225358.1 hypothetical protein VCHA39P230_20441 [Vibrio chagasii]CAH7236993.1 hypothetical protein VCHA37P194_20439 [Vibrio chagasii]CAH7375789.1 hypothetical protein VCHA41O246_70215 [Vibrio chagasii]